VCIALTYAVLADADRVLPDNLDHAANDRSMGHLPALAAPDLSRAARWLSAVLGVYAIWGGVISLIGWVADIRQLTDWDNDGLSMQPNGTVAAMVAGTGVVCLAMGQRRVAAAAGLVAALTGVTALFEHLSGVNLGIDTLLLFDRPWGYAGTLMPGRMGPPGATAWTLLGAGLILTLGGPKSRQAASALGLTAMCLAGLSLIGYLLGADTLYSLPRLTAIALQTSTMIFAVGTGLVVALSDRQPMRVLLDNSAAGILARRSLPFVVTLPIVLGWLTLKGQEAGLFDTPMGVALLVLSLLILLSAVLWWGVAAVAVRERELAKVNEARIRADMVLGAARDQFIVLDRHWRYTYINDRVVEVAEMPQERMIGRTLWEVWPAIVGSPLEHAARRVMARREAESLEYYYPPSKRWFDTRLYPTAEGGVALIVLEITDRKRAEEAVREADRRKDEFLATLAHELRNPLAAISNSLEIMKRAGGSPDLIEHSRATMDRQMRQIVRLTDDLLDVSRITRNKLELRTQRVELASVIQDAVATCRPMIDAAGQQLAVLLPPEPVHLNADPVRLTQVFANLLNNASKYTERGGDIRLTVERQGSEVVVKVEDTGVGIAPDMLAGVFEMFAQVDRSLERRHGGLGIGLTLVKRLVELHQGTVTAHSEGKGRGSEFVVRLPVLIDTPKPEHAPEPDGDSIPATARRILIVDDNADAAASLATLLELTGNETEIAHDGVEAVEKAAAYGPDMILLDIGLPKMNGYDACRAIREKQWGKKVVVVALTGWGQDVDRRRSKEAGFNGHLVKPVDHATLMNLLASLSAAVPPASAAPA
jgi:signal transduction histidine kinase/ActR/RegA family two-component response regulator